ncbi:MAG: hypothetical protein ACRDMV_01085 [Streptosporangiales bacterium]
MPRAKRPVGEVVDKRNGQHATLRLKPLGGDRVELPEGTELCAEARQVWDAYWDDPVSQAQTGVDRGLLLRWIFNMDRYWRLIGEADGSPLTENSQGRSANPLYAVALKVEASIKADEAQLGVGPKNRSALGIAIVSEQRSLADMNARYGGDGGGGEDAEREQDPRLEAAGDRIRSS